MVGASGEGRQPPPHHKPPTLGCRGCCPVRRAVCVPAEGLGSRLAPAPTIHALLIQGLQLSNALHALRLHQNKHKQAPLLAPPHEGRQGSATLRAGPTGPAGQTYPSHDAAWKAPRRDSKQKVDTPGRARVLWAAAEVCRRPMASATENKTTRAPGWCCAGARRAAGTPDSGLKQKQQQGSAGAPAAVTGALAAVVIVLRAGSGDGGWGCEKRPMPAARMACQPLSLQGTATGPQQQAAGRMSEQVRACAQHSPLLASWHATLWYTQCRARLAARPKLPTATLLVSAQVRSPELHTVNTSR